MVSQPVWGNICITKLDSTRGNVRENLREFFLDFGMVSQLSQLRLMKSFNWVGCADVGCY